MTKKFFVIILAMCVIFSSFAYAQENEVFNVIPYDFEIFWNGNKFESNSPVLLIDGQTYVPLREWSEQIGMDVHWNGESRKITMTESGVEFEEVFSSTLDFELPQTAEIIDYAYGRYGRDVSLNAKIFFKANDLAYMQSQLDGIGSLLSEDEMEEEIELINTSKRLDWWDITSPKDAQYAYFGFMEGVEIKTYTIWALICEAPELDGYYLYIAN